MRGPALALWGFLVPPECRGGGLRPFRIAALGSAVTSSSRSHHNWILAVAPGPRRKQKSSV